MRPTTWMQAVAAGVVVAGALSAAAARGQTGAGEERDRVGVLIQQLSSDDYQTREGATQELVQLGEAALPRLEQLLPLTVDGETRNRIQAAVDQITEMAVAGASLITLDVAGADAKGVFEEVSRQARAKIVVSPEVLASLPKVTFKCEREPFWPVMRRLCSPLGLQPDSLNLSGVAAAGRRGMAAPDRTLNLIRTANVWDRTPTAFSGPFMVCVQQITETGVVVPAVDQRVHTLVVQCVVIAEPKLTVVGRSHSARVTEPDPAANPPVAIPGVNNPMMNIRSPFAGRMYPGAASSWPMVIPLVRPKDATDRLRRLSATGTAKLLVRSENWELPDIGRAAPRFWTAGGRTFTVKSVKRQGENIEVIATATRRAGDRSGIDPEEQAVFNYLELLDPNGRALTVRARSQRGSEEPGTIAYTLNFEATAEGAPVQPPTTPLRLRWRLPLDTKDVELKMEFEGLPLP